MPKALGALRLSRNTDATTSPERQTGRIVWWAAGNDCDEPVHIAEDLDVSGAVSPFEREGLGPWLTDEKAHEWDVLVAWKLDRISRSASDTLLLLQWCEQRGKRIVCVDDGLDSGTKMGKLWIQLAAIFAEMERNAIQERVEASRAELRRTGRWAGGTPPFGFVKVKVEEGGWKVAHHETNGPLVIKMARAVAGLEPLREGGELKPESFDECARWLNELGVPPVRKNNKNGWVGNSVKRILSNATVRWGKSVHNKQVLEHVDYAEPLLTSWEAFRLDIAMKAREQKRGGRGPVKLLTGVVWCGECDAIMYQFRTWWRCSGRTIKKTACRNSYVHASVVETYTEREFLARVGSEEMFQRIELPGSDSSAELANVKERIRKLANMFESGALDESDEEFVASLAALKRRRKELEVQPKTEAHVMLVPTDVHYIDVWEEGDNDSRRAALLDRKVRVVVKDGEVDQEERLRFVMDEELALAAA